MRWVIEFLERFTLGFSSFRARKLNPTPPKKTANGSSLAKKQRF
jgi:hypothetical protein